MPLDILQQKWFSGTTLDAASKLLAGNVGGLARMEKHFLSNLFWHYLHAEPGRVSEVEGIADFFCYAFPRRANSKSQILQDLWVLYQNKEKREGYFVEFGACDGVTLSNTLLLEKGFGWTGIIAEPNPIWHEALTKNRSCHISKKCVHNKHGEMVTFSCSTIPELSRISNVIPEDIHERTGNRVQKQSIDVETISLFNLLREVDAPRYIDYLSIDTEGSEELILRNFNFDIYQFGCITIEHAGEQQKRDAIYDLLTKNGYRRWHPEMSRWDDWYVSSK